MSLNAKTWLSLVVLALVMGALIFGAAHTFDYWQGWLFLAVFFGAGAWISFDLMKRDPALLERRLKGGPTAEKAPKQRLIMLFASLGFIALIVVPPLDHYYRWTHVSGAISVIGAVVMLIGFYIVMRVFRANTYTAATIQVAEGQRVISTGPYAFVRHPMYSGALLYMLATPVTLGSWSGLIAFAALLVSVIWRLFDEEKTLSRELPGYTEYMKRVRYRLIPRIW